MPDTIIKRKRTRPQNGKPPVIEQKNEYSVEDFLEGRVPRFEGELDVFHLKVPKKFNLREVAYDLD
ncbi:MAG: hypothetical protein HY960_14670 [Ignavibacteriae bacterium]|nr:hypothetical protein [Ignavibacteriota bacterium]